MIDILRKLLITKGKARWQSGYAADCKSISFLNKINGVVHLFTLCSRSIFCGLQTLGGQILNMHGV